MTNDTKRNAVTAFIFVLLFGAFIFAMVAFCAKTDEAIALEMQKTFTVKFVDGTEIQGLKRARHDDIYRFKTTNGEVVSIYNTKSILFVKEENRTEK